MSLERKTVLDEIEIRRDGTVQVRLVKCVIDSEEPETPLAQEFHRTVIPPGISVEDQIAAVNDHLQAMKAGPCAAEDWDRVRAVASLVQTPEVVAAFRAKQEAAARATA